MIDTSRTRLGWLLSLLPLAVLPSSMAQSAAQRPPILDFTPAHANGIYQRGETVSWTATLHAGAAPPAFGFSYTIRKNNAEVLKTGHFDLSKGPVSIDVVITEPAMVYVEVDSDQRMAPSRQEMQHLNESFKKLLAQSDSESKATLDKYPDLQLVTRAVPPPGAPPANRITTLGAAVEPTKLQPSVAAPADFWSFWQGQLKRLRAIPIQPVLTPSPTTANGIDLYTVQLDSVGSKVHGYLAKPTRPGKFPALVIYQYAGVYKLQPSTVTSRAADGWLAFDVDSHDIAPDTDQGVPQGYQAINNNDRDSSYFLNMYLRDSRAIEYIRSRPDWDGKTIVLMGTSMGGQQSLVTAGLNPESVTAVLVNEPSGADSNGDLHGRKAGYPNWPSNDPLVMKTALYFDTVNFASHINAPLLAAMGFIDTTAPPVGIWTAINQTAGPKEPVPMIESDHNNITPDKQAAYNQRVEQVLQLLLHGESFRPTL